MSKNVVSMLRAKLKASDATVQLVHDLRELVIESLRDRLNLMFDGADDLLFEFAESATNNNDRRLFFDAMRAIRLGRKDMMRQFCESIADGFEGGLPMPASGSRLHRPYDHDDDEEEVSALEKSASVELSIAVSNMATKADALCRQTLSDINGRIRGLIDDSRAELLPDALSPSGIINAFRGCAEALDVGFAVELVIFKLFDRLVISDLAGLYAQVLLFFTHHGVRSPAFAVMPANAADASEGAAPRVRSAGPRSAVAVIASEAFRPSLASSLPFVATPVPAAAANAASRMAASMMMLPTLDPQTLSSLQRVIAETPDAAASGNASLAADLAAAARGQIVSGWNPHQTTAYLQRASLVGHMFNDILADPHLPSHLRAQFDELRLSAIKVALTDSAFILDPDHPVRALINELATMATTARASGQEGLEGITELVSEIHKQFDIAAETLRKPAVDIERIDTEQAARFVEQQVAQTNVRRQAMVKRVRRIITEELQLRSRGHALVEDVRVLLHSAWAPMMAMHLLHHGPDSRRWKEGMSLLDRVLHSLDPSRVETRGKLVLTMLFDDIEIELKAVGLTAERIRSALDGYGRVLESIDAASAESTALDPPDTAVSSSAVVPGGGGSISELLEQLIAPGAWFLVHDHDRDERRWMKAVAYYAGLDCAAFAEFNGSHTLLLKSRMLLDDLVARRTVPIELGPTARAALDRFRARAI